MHYIMFVKLRKCWRMLQSAVSLCTPENSAIQKLSIIIIIIIWKTLIVHELCESRGGRPELSVLTSLLVSVDVKNY